MSDYEERMLLHFLAKKAKEWYREKLVFQAVSQGLRSEGNTLFDSLVEEVRKSKSVEVAAILFESAIDAKMPPSPEADLQMALEKYAQVLGLKKEKMN